MSTMKMGQVALEKADKLTREEGKRVAEKRLESCPKKRSAKKKVKIFKAEKLTKDEAEHEAEKCKLRKKLSKPRCQM